MDIKSEAEVTLRMSQAEAVEMQRILENSPLLASASFSELYVWLTNFCKKNDLLTEDEH